MRKTTNYQSNGPVTDVSSTQLRCYQLAAGSEGAQTMSVAAGATVGFVADASISHPGTLQFYMAKVPAGQTAASFDGSGAVWFKIFSQGPNISPAGLTWPSQGLRDVAVQIPQCLAPGDYLIRIEHIALHSAGSAGGAQFYIACVFPLLYILTSFSGFLLLCTSSQLTPASSTSCQCCRYAD